MHLANTVSTTFAGLYKIGHAWGCKDKAERRKREHPYYDYRVAKAGANDILNLLDDGYTLIFAPDSGWPNHPFQLVSGGGGIVYRRTTKDVVLAQEADCYTHRQALRHVMAEAGRI